MAYNGRRGGGVNVSEYIANLNAIPTAQDIENSQENFNMDDELAMFTNAQFLDFDGLNADLQSTGFGAEGQGAAPESADMKSLDFDLPGTTSILCTSYTPSMLLFICYVLPLSERQVVISSGSSTTQPRCVFNAYQTPEPPSQ
jgi:hypothetical protein